MLCASLQPVRVLRFFKYITMIANSILGTTKRLFDLWLLMLPVVIQSYRLQIGCFQVNDADVVNSFQIRTEARKT